MKTTLNKIRSYSPCNPGWKKLLANLGKTKADDEELLITTVLESNGIDDALWCLRAVEGHEREMRLFAVECARSVQYLMTDPRSINAIDVAERFANNLATEDELNAAWAAARDASASIAAAAAGTAAWAAACGAAWAAADPTDVAWDAAGDAADPTDIAWDAAGDDESYLLILVCEGCFDE